MRHLIFHVLPVADHIAWRWNVNQLLERIDIFDGVRSVAIATQDEHGPKLDDFHEVIDAFRGVRIDNWIIRENSKRLREVATWIPLLRTVEQSPGITFSCHAKGVTRAFDPDDVCRWWTEAMWQSCLDDIPFVDSVLERHVMAGSFKRYPHFSFPGSHEWHYSGTFYWFRNDVVFGRDWSQIVSKEVGWWTEAWPGYICTREEGGVLFMDMKPDGDPYLRKWWNSVARPAWDQWKTEHGLK